MSERRYLCGPIIQMIMAGNAFCSPKTGDISDCHDTLGMLGTYSNRDQEYF